MNTLHIIFILNLQIVQHMSDILSYKNNKYDSNLLGNQISKREFGIFHTKKAEWHIPCLK